MSDKKEAEKAQTPTPRDIFEGIRVARQRQIESWRSGSPLPRAEPLRCLHPRLLLAGARGGHNGGNSALRDVEPLRQRSGGAASRPTSSSRSGADPRSLPYTLPATARCPLPLPAVPAHLMSGRQEAVSVCGIRPVTASRTGVQKDGPMVLAHGYRAARQGSLPGPASRSWRERREAFPGRRRFRVPPASE